MITADVERVQLGFRKLHDAWGPLVSVGIGLWLVELQLGYSSLVTLGLIVGMVHPDRPYPQKPALMTPRVFGNFCLLVHPCQQVPKDLDGRD
jgi:hypothetical protein